MSPMASDDAPAGSIPHPFQDGADVRAGTGDPYAGAAAKAARKGNPMKASRPKSGTMGGKGAGGGKKRG